MQEVLLDTIDDKFMRNRKDGMKTYRKAIVTGHVIEIYEYERMPILPSKKKDKKELDPDDDDKCDDTIIKDRQNNMIKARNRLRRLITANFDENSKFITLTFKDNVTDVKQANKEFKKFIQRMRYRYNNFKYIAVIEFQQRGAVHYHMISDLPYIENSQLNKIWGHGFVKINDISHVDNVGAYMIKYMTKDNTDLRLRGLKSYQTSKNLVRPLEFVGDEVDKIKEIYGLDNKKIVFANTFTSEYLGIATYKEYNLKRL